MHQWVRLFNACILAGIFTLSLPAMAADGNAESAIRERIAALEKAWSQGDADFVAAQVFGADAVILGEGQKESIRTAESVRDVIRHLIADSRALTMTVHSVRPLGPESALTWVVWHVTPKATDSQPFDVRSLFVWTRGQEGWRIRADSYSMGGW